MVSKRYILIEDIIGVANSNAWLEKLTPFPNGISFVKGANNVIE